MLVSGYGSVNPHLDLPHAGTPGEHANLKTHAHKSIGMEYTLMVYCPSVLTVLSSRKSIKPPSRNTPPHPHTYSRVSRHDSLKVSKLHRCMFRKKKVSSFHNCKGSRPKRRMLLMMNTSAGPTKTLSTELAKGRESLLGI